MTLPDSVHVWQVAGVICMLLSGLLTSSLMDLPIDMDFTETRKQNARVIPWILPLFLVGVTLCWPGSPQGWLALLAVGGIAKVRLARRAAGEASVGRWV